MIRVKKNVGRITQGDIYKDVEYAEYAVEKRGIIEVSKIIFPLVIVLTQDCDLEQDYKYRYAQDRKTDYHDKWLLSVLVAPLYNAEHVFLGEHLTLIDLKMQNINKNSTKGNLLKQNEIPRYHYLEFPDEFQVAHSIIDFKHYFCVNVRDLHRIRSRNFVCSVSSLYREDISLRFANFLSRIGLPSPVDV